MYNYICVYTSNYFDEKEVLGVRQKLYELKVDIVCEPKIYYKPEIFTYLKALGDKEKYRYATYICILFIFLLTFIYELTK